MKTDHLIEVLARNAGPAPRAQVARRLTPAAILGLLSSAMIAIGVFGAVPAELFATPVPWIKLAYGGALAVAAGRLTARLARPAAPWQGAQRATVTVAGVMLAAAAVWLLGQPQDSRLEAVLGHSWASCPWSVLALSLPALMATLWALRGLAPTQPGRAGFAAGLLAGAVGACGYALSCPEASAAFVAAWYTLGIVLTGVLGAVVGSRVLRW